MADKLTDHIVDSIEHTKQPPEETSSEEFSIFRTFLAIEDARELAELLEHNKIPFSLIDNAFSVDITFTGENNQRNIQVLVKKSDFKKAQMAIEAEAQMQVQKLPPDYYLFQFNNTELLEILEKKDEWSELDYFTAKKILTDRGIAVDQKKLDAERLVELSEPETGQTGQIIAGYFFALCGGIIGLMIGWYLWKSKKTLPNGEKQYTYGESQRNHGRQITIISFVILPIAICWRIFYEFSRI